MRKYVILSAAFAVLMSATSFAQFSQSAFFLDNCSYGYRANAAIQSEKSFFAIGLGNIGVTASSNIGVTSVLYPTADGRLVTGLNSAVSSEQFLGSLQDVSNVNAGLNLNLLSVGVRDSLSFFNFEVNARMLGSVALPKDMFTFLKNGSRASAYDLSSTDMDVKAFLEASFGYSRQFGKFTAGARAKLLLGLASVDLDVRKADIYANGSEIGYDADATLRSAASFIDWELKKDTEDILDLGGMCFIDNMGISGVGAAIDLGVSYEPVDGLTLTAGVSDLGFIKWNYNTVARTSAVYSFTGASNIDIEGENSIGDELDDAFERLKGLADFHKTDEGESAVESLGMTMNAGVRYRMPFYRRLSVGGLYTQRVGAGSRWLDARLGATVTPVNWLSLTGSYGITGLGKTFGTALSLTFAGINLYAGVESYSGMVTKFKSAPVPLDPFRFNFNFGLNITIGQRRTHYAGRSSAAPVQVDVPAVDADPIPTPVSEPDQETSPESIAAAAAQSAS